MKPATYVLMAALVMGVLAAGCQIAGVRPATCPPGAVCPTERVCPADRVCPPTRGAYGPCGVAPAGLTEEERLIGLAPYQGYLRAHNNFQTPFALLGGPIQVSVAQNEGGVHVALPDKRNLDPQVFGTPRYPRALEGTAIISGVPPAMRAATRGEYTELKEPSPFGNRVLVLPEGRLMVEALDITATDAAVSQDTLRFEASWKDEQGNTYALRSNQVVPHGVEYPSFGGVATNHLVHGSSRIGTPLLPTQFAYLAFWGVGESLKNGVVLDNDILVHGMLTEFIRTDNYALAFDDQITPSRLHMHILAPPLIVRNGRYLDKPVRTGFTLPNGEELAFWHVMFDNLEIDSERLPIRPAMTMLDGGTPIQEVQGEPAAEIVMTDRLRFVPEQAAIQAGETVRWTNESRLVHTVTADPSLAIDESHVHLPEGAEPFNSGNIKPGDTYSRTFTVPGTYRYFCIPHEANGMIGEVIVKGSD